MKTAYFILVFTAISIFFLGGCAGNPARDSSPESLDDFNEGNPATKPYIDPIIYNKLKSEGWVPVIVQIDNDIRSDKGEKAWEVNLKEAFSSLQPGEFKKNDYSRLEAFFSGEITQEGLKRIEARQSIKNITFDLEFYEAKDKLSVCIERKKAEAEIIFKSSTISMNSIIISFQDHVSKDTIREILSEHDLSKDGFKNVNLDNKDQVWVIIRELGIADPYRLICKLEQNYDIVTVKFSQIGGNA